MIFKGVKSYDAKAPMTNKTINRTLDRHTMNKSLHNYATRAHGPNAILSVPMEGSPDMEYSPKAVKFPD